MANGLDLQTLVDRHYVSLYQFAVSLTHNEHEASDLTQQVFMVWVSKGHQLREGSKVKTWLFTTLYREFLQKQRRQTRFPHLELAQADDELPTVSPTVAADLDSRVALDALGQLDETFRAPLALFYLEEYSYKEIAEILEIPLGTVKSRLARGVAQLQQLLTPRAAVLAMGRKGASHG